MEESKSNQSPLHDLVPTLKQNLVVSSNNINY